jgi:hypothetical protein
MLSHALIVDASNVATVVHDGLVCCRSRITPAAFLCRRVDDDIRLIGREISGGDVHRR